MIVQMVVLPGGMEFDAVWVECTPDEADREIAPYLDPNGRTLMRDLRNEYESWSPNTLVLVACDLSVVRPMHATYPFDNLWGAYSPFRPIPPLKIQSLQELHGLRPLNLLVGPQSARDTPFTARMRFHQSWYRVDMLRLPYGTGPREQSTTAYGNMLSRDDAAVGANFLDDAIFAVVQERLVEGDWLVERYRVLHNMLASQAMCFNLFAPLQRDLDFATHLFRALMPDEIDRVTAVRLEHAPRPAGEYLNDRTAFDAFVEYTRPDGGKAFVGIETKLTEPFSQQDYSTERYRELTQRPDSPWLPDAWPAVADVAHNQLWRDHLLAWAMLQHPASPYTRGRLMLVRHPGDSPCADVVAGYRRLLRPADTTFVDMPLDRLVSEWKVAGGEETADWLDKFEMRYLRLDDSEHTWRTYHS